MEALNIAMIGVGALGKRHLESVLKSDMPFHIYCIDANKEAVESVLTQEREGKKIFGGCDTSILPEVIDAAIIATSAGVRRQLFEELTECSTVKNIIFEKVLFQRIEDYYYVGELLKKKDIKAWVNCTRREWDSYYEIKKYVDACKGFEVHVSGGNWGLACNAIHMLDFIEFLEGVNTCQIKDVNILPCITESKRHGYKEVFGSLEGNCGRCRSFTISCFEEGDMPLTIEIIGDSFKCIIEEGRKHIYMTDSAHGWKLEEKVFEIYYQSQLTQKIVESILKNGTCRLPGYEEAMKLHLTYLEPLMKFFEEQGLEKGICPIT